MDGGRWFVNSKLVRKWDSTQVTVTSDEILGTETPLPGRSRHVL